MLVRYALAITMFLINLQMLAMAPSAARRSGATLLNLGRNAQQRFLPTNLQKIGQVARSRANLINLKQQNALPQRSFSSFFNQKAAPSFTQNKSWWQTPAKITTTLAGGIGLTKLSTYLYRQWDLSNLETFVNNMRIDLQTASLEQIFKNIQTLQYYAKIDDPNTTPKAKELLHELRNLYITKKYQEMPTETFVETVIKGPRHVLLSIKNDILFVHENNDITVPQTIVNQVVVLKNTPYGDLLLSELEKNLARDIYRLNHDIDNYFLKRVQQDIAVWKALKDILKPDPRDQPESHSFDQVPGDPLLHF